MEATRQQGGCTGRRVGRCCWAVGQNIWLVLWGEACARGVLTVSRFFFVLSPWGWPADHGSGDWIPSHDCARHAAVRRYVWPPSLREACTNVVHVGYDYVTPTRPADMWFHFFSARDTLSVIGNMGYVIQQELSPRIILIVFDSWEACSSSGGWLPVPTGLGEKSCPEQ